MSTVNVCLSLLQAISDVEHRELMFLFGKHGRRSSYEFEDIPSLPSYSQEEITSNGSPTSNSMPPSVFSPGATQNGTISPTRKRVLSNPGYGTPGTMSASPYRTSFKPGSPSGSPVLNGVPGHQRNGSSTSFVPGHMRNGSTSSYGSDTNNVRGSISSVSGRPEYSTPNGQAAAPYGPPGTVAHGFQFRGGHARSPSTNSDIAGSPFRSTFASIDENLPDSTLSTSSSIQGPNPPSDAPPSPTLSNSSYHVYSSSAHARRHSRIHSRNLSIYFPRPGATTVHSIAEDGAQEIEAPVTLISGGGPTPTLGSGRTRPTPQSSSFVSSPQPRTQLGGGFKFGGKPPPSATSNSQSQSGNTSPTGSEGPGSVPMSKAATPNTSASQSTGTASRRGHHHRHSLSHSFFSFMEPSPSASSPAYNHRKQPSSGLTLSVTGASPTSTNTPISALPTASGWGPISPFPLSTTAAAFPSAQIIPPKRTMAFHPAALPNPSTQRSSSLVDKVTTLPGHMRNSLAFASLETLLGCVLWVMGQHAESLACTGLAYWIVFDALGVGLGVYGRLVEAGVGQGSLRLPYGAKRMETTAIFAQAVYLMFAAVYICKETLEHALLSAGDAGHHHHHEQGRGGVLSTGVLFKNNVKVLDATGVYLPSVRQTLRFFSSPNNWTTR
ncbi:1073_t:CDS:2, partial [Acaulospora colombiana]